VISDSPLVWIVEPNTDPLGERLDARSLHPKRVNTLHTIKKLCETKGYQLKRLKETSKFIRINIDPKQYSKKTIHLGVGHIDSECGVIKLEIVYSNELESQKVKTRSGDILFSRIRPYLNKVAIVPKFIKEALASTEFFILRPSTNKYYLLSFLRSKYTLDQVVPLVTGSSRPRLRKEDVADILVIFPSKEQIKTVEQCMIEAEKRLKQSESYLHKLKQSTKNLFPLSKHLPYPIRFSVDKQILVDRLDPKYYYSQALLKKSVLSFVKKKIQIENKPLSSVTTKISTGITPAKEQYTEVGMPIIKVNSLTNQGIAWENISYVPKPFYKKSSRAHIKTNDILVLSSAHSPEAIASKIDIVNDMPFSEAMIVGELMLIRPNVKIVNPWYLLWYLRSPIGRAQFKGIIRGETAHIYKDDVSKIEVIIPLEFQTEIGNLLKRSETSRRSARYLMAKASTLIETLLV
jgi:restriction endonuclease S subunit